MDTLEAKKLKRQRLHDLLRKGKPRQEPWLHNCQQIQSIRNSKEPLLKSLF